MLTNLDKNLSELEDDAWVSPEFDSHVVTESHRLRLVALKDFTAEDLRFMIGQEIGLSYLVPLALEHLETDAFTAGDFYPGDLLNNVLGIPINFWTRHSDLRREMRAVVENALARIDSITIGDDIKEPLRRQLNAFW